MITVKSNYLAAINNIKIVSDIYNLVGVGVASSGEDIDHQAAITNSEVSEGIITSFHLATTPTNNERVQLIDDLMDTWYTVAGLAVVTDTVSELGWMATTDETSTSFAKICRERKVPYRAYPIHEFTAYFGRLHGLVLGIREMAKNDLAMKDILTDFGISNDTKLTVHAAMTHNATIEMINAAFVLIAELATLMHVDLEIAARAVGDSNYSKFTTSHALLNESIEKYIALGVVVRYEERVQGNKVWHVLYSAMDQVVGGKSYPKDKYLKCNSFREPDYTGASKWTPYTLVTESIPLLFNVTAGETIMLPKVAGFFGKASFIVHDVNASVVADEQGTHITVKNSQGETISTLGGQGMDAISVTLTSAGEVVSITNLYCNRENLQWIKEITTCQLQRGYIAIDGQEPHHYSDKQYISTLGGQLTLHTAADESQDVGVCNAPMFPWFHNAFKEEMEVRNLQDALTTIPNRLTC